MIAKYYYLLVIIFCSLHVNTHANVLYKWVDEDGNVSYQDQPPPENSELLDEKNLKSQRELAREKASAEGPSNIEPVIVYTVKDCSKCKFILFELDYYKVPYSEVGIDGDKQAQSELFEKSGGVTVPTVSVDDVYLNDFSEGKLKELLLEKGYQLNEDPKEKIFTNEEKQ